MLDKIVETFSDIEYYGQLWEEQKELDSRYSPSPTADKMRVKGAAFKPPLKAKSAAADTEVDDTCAATTAQQNNNKNSKQTNQQQTHTKTMAEIASISDTDPNELAGKLMALLCPSGTAMTGAPSVASPPFKATL